MNRLIITFIILILFSCGPSREEREQAQRLREDSIRNSVVEKFARIERLKDSLASAEISLRSASSRLIDTRAELEAARDKLVRIKQFQFLRTGDEREQQIKDQTIVIENLEMEVRRLATGVDDGEATIRKLKNNLSMLK